MFGAKSSRRAFFFTLLLVGMLASNSQAQVPRNPSIPAGTVRSLADLKSLKPEQLKQLYAAAPAGRQPVGYMRGEVLYLDKTLLPRSKILVAGAIWRGKHFDEDAGFINQWTAFRAINSSTYQGPSYFDGRPSIILEYSNLIPYFGKMRDEMREVAPGVYLAMVFEKAEPHRFRGYIGLELEAPKELRIREFLKSER